MASLQLTAVDIEKQPKIGLPKAHLELVKHTGISIIIRGFGYARAIIHRA